jgi:DNA-binding transcriptional MerR regulator
MMKKEIPDKIYFKIGEVARLADVAPHVLRYWEAEFTEISPKRTQAGQRLYRRSDVELILTIKELLHTRGYTIAGARKLITGGTVPTAQQRGESASAVPDGDRLREIKNELEEIHRRLSIPVRND